MSYKLLSYPEDATLAREAAKSFLEKLATRNKTTPFTVALSGGRIAKTFFTEIVRQSLAQPASFTGVHFYWADERCVPPTDPESNYAVARQLLLEPLMIPRPQIHRLQGEQPEPVALQEAVKEIVEVAGLVEGQPQLDLVILGMGEDGHVASLFPGEPEAVMADPAVYRAVTAVKPPPKRITLGYGAIAKAVETWVMVSGAGKEKALGQSLSGTDGTPLGRVVKLRKETLIFSDVKPV
jgi:6-phosphogluconolactonase